MFERRGAFHFNWWYLALILTISIMGVVMVYSANHGRPEPFFQNLYIRQIYWLLCSLVALIVAVLIDYRLLSRYAYLIYFLTLAALILVLFFGTTVSGSRRWLQLGPVNLQISELAKLSMVIVLAKYFETVKPSGQYEFKDLFLPAVFTGAMGWLIYKQPDLGTAMIIAAIFFIFVIAVELKPSTLYKLIGICTVLTPMGWFFLKDYQKARIMTFLNQEMDPLGAGYQTIQSKIAIGSGGFWGKGLLAGTQSRLNFLPEKHTDFIFSVFAEETGFFGVAVLLTLFLILILKGLNIAYRAADRFGLFMAIGITGYLSLYIIYNLGMTIGIFPITGIPLPLFSYGGSSLLTTFFALGLLLNIEARRSLL
ncbi:MAG: rod shape-determining protein RodA [Candidatus Nitronauta litoralis]|uniref:Peptidoglycan glycosyltransferase RodA n=1 Tax=Candidatus Nitronauta litoralis TaxID=2705533 RepID=A0A7T0BVV9_9BACT|nr:MAG: rod shape-determining protein RodA [Candidatus Nitronauta litoralis]